MRRACAKAAILSLGFAYLALVGAGFIFLRGPVRQESPVGWVAVASLSSLRNDGSPQPHVVRVPQFDAWTRLPDCVIGGVFVRRLPGTRQVIALRADHHRSLHIPVIYDETARLFRSSCWQVQVEFDLDGQEIERIGESRMGDELQKLPVRIADDVVWVQYGSSTSGGM